MSLTGTWHGHYFQNILKEAPVEMDESSEWAFPICAELQERDGLITGTMVDLKTCSELSGSEVYSQLAPTLTWLQKREWHAFLRHCPEAIMKVKLPSTSKLEGDVDGSHVSFVKAYDGFQETSWVTTERESIERVLAASVYYVGELKDEDSLIVGTFKVVDPIGKAPTSYGRFRMQRSQEHNA